MLKLIALLTHLKRDIFLQRFPDWDSKKLGAELALWVCDLCSHTGFHTSKGLALGLMLSFCHLETLNSFWTRDLTSSICTQPHNLCSWQANNRKFFEDGKKLRGEKHGLLKSIRKWSLFLCSSFCNSSWSYWFIY